MNWGTHKIRTIEQKSYKFVRPHSSNEKANEAQADEAQASTNVFLDGLYIFDFIHSCHLHN